MNGNGVETWMKELYAEIDAMRIDGVLSHIASDGEVVFANNPPAVGHVAIREALTSFWGAIGGLRHERRNVWMTDSGVVLEATVHYATHGGADVPLPCVSVIERPASGPVTSLRIYIDLADLFAAIGAESVASPVEAP